MKIEMVIDFMESLSILIFISRDYIEKVLHLIIHIITNRLISKHTANIWSKGRAKITSKTSLNNRKII